MSEDERRASVKQELYKAIAYFIERQHLVAQAMLDLGLDLKEVDKYGPVAWASAESGNDFNCDELDSEDERTKEILEVRKRAQANQVSQLGTWRDSTGTEWRYFLHGPGCLLTNTHTHEKINWNCPNALSFDPYFFLDHLEWQLASSKRRHNLKTLQSWIGEKGSSTVIGLIEEMVEAGLINSDMTLPDCSPNSPLVH